MSVQGPGDAPLALNGSAARFVESGCMPFTAGAARPEDSGRLGDAQAMALMRSNKLGCVGSFGLFGAIRRLLP
jgi:hypothetical protein